MVRYIGRHGNERVAKAVLIGAIPPLMLKTQANPGGLPIEAFDQIRAGVLADRSQFFKDLTMPFYGYNRPGATVSQGLRDAFWLQGMMAGFPAAYLCIKAFSETDLTEDLQKFDVPTLVLHGDDDQIVPIGASALLSSKLIKNAILKVYKGAPHGMCSTHKDQINAVSSPSSQGELTCSIRDGGANHARKKSGVGRDHGARHAADHLGDGLCPDSLRTLSLQHVPASIKRFSKGGAP